MSKKNFAQSKKLENVIQDFSLVVVGRNLKKVMTQFNRANKL